MAKANKIEAVLARICGIPACGLRILDVGCGSGDIALHFSRSNSVVAVDVVDQRTIVSGHAFEFVLLDGQALAKENGLPFPDRSFDVVILNHVLYYFPDPEMALRECARVLAEDGACYVALANRLFPIDPHSWWPLVHYLPEAAYRWLLGIVSGHREAHVRLWFPWQMRSLLRGKGLCVIDVTGQVMASPQQFGMTRAPRLPAWLAKLSPTSLFVLKKSMGRGKVGA